jgi:protein TonB
MNIAVSKIKPDHNESRWTTLRWGICFALIAGLHIGAAWIALQWTRRVVPVPSSPPAAVMINLAPLPTAPSTPPNQPPPTPQQTPSPPLPSPAPQIAIPLPPPSPPKPLQLHRTLEHRQPPKRITAKATPAPTAPPQAPAQPAPTAAAPASGTPSPTMSSAVPNWEARLLGRIDEFKQYPSEAEFHHQEGVVYLHFIMNRQGQILSASIIKSSGFSALDQEALARIRRAEPLPPPPPELVGDTIPLTIPLRFILQQ